MLPYHMVYNQFHYLNLFQLVCKISQKACIAYILSGNIPGGGGGGHVPDVNIPIWHALHVPTCYCTTCRDRYSCVPVLCLTRARVYQIGLIK